MSEYHSRDAEWNRQTRYVRQHIERFRATRDAADTFGLAGAIHEELERIRSIDASLGDELETEWCDASSGDQSTWPAETDSDRWTIVPDDTYPGGAERGLSLAEWIASVAETYRQLGTDAAALVAECVADLAATVRVVGATTPAQARDRMNMLACR